MGLPASARSPTNLTSVAFSRRAEALGSRQPSYGCSAGLKTQRGYNGRESRRVVLGGPNLAEAKRASATNKALADAYQRTRAGLDREGRHRRPKR